MNAGTRPVDVSASVSRLPPGLAAFATAQGGVFTRAQALEAGYDDRAIRAELRAHRWCRIRRGAFVEVSLFDAVTASTLHLLVSRAVVLAVDDACCSHQTAALWHGLFVLGDPPPDIHVTRCGHGSSRREGGVVHHDATLPPEERIEIHGIPVTTLARTVVDVARVSGYRAGVVTADSALRHGASRAELVGVLERCRDWPGSRAAGLAISFADGRAESPGESLARLLVHQLGFPAPQPQWPVTLAGSSCRVDLGWPEFSVLLEFDGRVKYSELTDDPAAVAWAERRRQVALEDAGWEVVRITWSDLFHPEWVREKLVRAFARAAARRTRHTMASATR